MPLGLQLTAALAADPLYRTEPIRRRTLILLRWIALSGQLAAITASWITGVHFNVLATLFLIMIGASLNFWMTLSSSRITTNGATWQLLFDVVQISALIGLTGGMSNPFALLALVPATIAATALGTSQTVLVSLITIAMISLASWFAVPLRHHALDLTMPVILQYAHFTAILIGVIFFTAYTRRVAVEHTTTGDALFATQIALAREQKLQHLGGVIAAAAHEMGTPLATIKLISTELRDELDEILTNRADIKEDIAALAESADRCRDILRSMGRAGKDDLQLHAAPLRTILEEAAAPHAERGPVIEIKLLGKRKQPTILRSPGTIHGLRNIIQNGVDFAKSRVLISSDWDETELRITIEDDGPGYTPSILNQIADPFPINRRSDPRPGYDGMGLGLFIARTLLEGSGAKLRFRNGRFGARVEIALQMARIRADDRTALQKNPPIL